MAKKILCHKEVEAIKRSHVILRAIKKKEKELCKIQRECKHEAAADFVDNESGNHTVKCLFCGEIMDESKLKECKYIFHLDSLDSLDRILPISQEEKYWIIRQIFIEIAKSKPQMPVDEICEKVSRSILKRYQIFYKYQIKAVFGNHD